MVKALPTKDSHHKQALGLCRGMGGGEEVGENNLCTGNTLRYNEVENQRRNYNMQDHPLQPGKTGSISAVLRASYSSRHPGTPFVFLLFWLTALSGEKSDNVSAALTCPEGFRSFKDRWRVTAFIPQVK